MRFRTVLEDYFKSFTQYLVDFDKFHLIASLIEVILVHIP